MKKLLSGLLLAPLALAACGDAAGSDKTATVYAYTHGRDTDAAAGSYITKVTATVGSDNIVKSIELEETLTKETGSNHEWAETTKAKYDALIKDNVKAVKITAPADKSICVVESPAMDNSTTPATKVDWNYVLVGKDGDTSTFDVTVQNPLDPANPIVTSITATVNKANCEATTPTSAIPVPLAGTWIEKGTATPHYATIKTGHSSTTPKFEGAYDLTKAMKWAGENTGGNFTWNAAVPDSAQFSDSAIAKFEKMSLGKMGSQSLAGLEYFKDGTAGKKGWKNSIDAITKFFVGKDYTTVTVGKFLAEGSTGTGVTAIAGATMADTEDYTQTIKEAFKDILAM